MIVQNKSSYIAEYYVGDDLCLMFRQSLLDKGEINVDDETAKREDVKNGNFTGVLFTYEKNDNIKIIWNDGEYTYDQYKKYDETRHKKICICGAEEYENHHWDDGVEITPATHVQEGIKSHTCKDCGETKTEIIPKLVEHRQELSVPAAGVLRQPRAAVSRL